jgi:hypothetical protein
MSVDTGKESENCDNQELLKKLHQVVSAIGEFKNRYDKKLNFSKLIKFLKLNDADTEEIVYLILRFQEQFTEIFKDHTLSRKIISGQTYLVPEKKLHNYIEKILLIPDTVRVCEKDSKTLSDVTYFFKYVHRGNGFDLEVNTTDLIKNVICLRQEHPYFFVKNGSNLVYPSQIALELGNMIQTYNKSNKLLKTITLHKCNFIFENNVS